jgi:glyoxylase-like metal-dependent hydrolase (beta-lactamase superfamily II)
MRIETFVEGPIDANNYLVIDEASNEAVLIDCSSARQEFVDKIKSSGVKLKYILLTHGHFDHLLGVDAFKNIFGVDAYVSEEDLEQVEMVPNMMQMFLGLSAPKINSIDHFVKDGDEFFIGNTKIQAISTAGHTQGGMSYLIGDKLFSGDTLFRASVGRTDLLGGDFKKLLHSVKDKLFMLPENVEVFTGHGEKTTIGYEKQYNEILNI